MVSSMKDLGEMHHEAQSIFQAGVKRVNPYRAIMEYIQVEGSRMHLGQKDRLRVRLELSEYNRIMLVGGGKATAPMARAMEDILGDRIDEGIINVKYGFTEKLDHTEIIEADHPLPDENGVKGTKKILDLMNRAGKKDLIFSLISGGGSALLPCPAGEVRLAEKQAVTKYLLECGARIDEINAIRKHISDTKGGQMARAAYPATTVNFMLSDVVGDRIDVIASGPFVPDRSTFEESWQILEKYNLIQKVPKSVSGHLKRGLEGGIPETPKEGDPIFERVHNYIIGSNILALEAASEEAERMGYNTLILSSMIEGETRDVARVHTAIAREILKSGRPIRPPCCIVSGGETTVTIRGKGLGGRNQEFCLAAAIDMDDLPERVVMLSGGTDGNDGPTDAAGAIVDPLTTRRGEEMGMMASEYLANNDSYHFFKKIGGLLMTGPTNTNVMDVRLILVK